MVITNSVGTENRTLYENVTLGPTQFVLVDEIRIGYRIAHHPGQYKVALVPGEVVREPYQGEKEELYDAAEITDSESREQIESAIKERESGLTSIVFGK